MTHILGWIALAFLILFGVCLVLGVATAMDQPATVTTTCTADYTTCTVTTK
jgi:hypothetical protein